jgi:hypothetical protein
MTTCRTAADDADTDAEDSEEEYEHLENIEAGAGCTEIWDRLSEQREG